MTYVTKNIPLHIVAEFRVYMLARLDHRGFQPRSQGVERDSERDLPNVTTSTWAWRRRLALENKQR